MHKKALSWGISLLLLSITLSNPASAGWTVTNLQPSLGTYSISQIYANNDGQQVGFATVNGRYHASLWDGTADGWIDLNPTESIDSRALGLYGNYQVGYTTNSGQSSHAALWNGTVDSYIDLNPTGSDWSGANAIYGSQIVGYARPGGSPNPFHAALWTGTAASWVDLNPTGSGDSGASAVYDNKQGGYATIGGQKHASLWSGTAASWQDLHPTGATASGITGMWGTEQGGYATIGGQNHASIWNGTAASWIDLNPTGATASVINEIFGDKQAGYATIGGLRHASLWNNTAASWVDLHSLLPSDVYQSSQANSIYTSGDDIWITGWGYTTDNNYRAVLWNYSSSNGAPPVPEPSSLMVLAFSLPGLAYALKRKSR